MDRYKVEIKVERISDAVTDRYGKVEKLGGSAELLSSRFISSDVNHVIRAATSTIEMALMPNPFRDIEQNND